MDFYSSSVIQLIEKAQIAPEKSSEKTLREIRRIKKLPETSCENGNKKIISLIS